MGVEDLTFSDRKNSYEGIEDEQAEIKGSKGIEGVSSPVIEDFYKSGKTSPRARRKPPMFLRGLKSIGKIMGFKKTDKFIDSTGKAAEESNIQDIDSTVSKEVTGVKSKRPVKEVSITKELNSVKGEENVFEEELLPVPVKETVPKVIKEEVKTMDSPEVREDFIANVAEEQGIDSTVSQDGKVVQNKETAKTARFIYEVESIADRVKEFKGEPVKEIEPKLTKEQVNDSLKVKPDIMENIVAEDTEKQESLKEESHDGKEKKEFKDTEKLIGEKEAETTMLMSLVDNINSTGSYLESDESQNSYDDPKKSTTQEAFFKLIDLLEDTKSTKFDSREKTHTFSTWAEKDDRKGRSQVSTVDDILKKSEWVTSSNTKKEDKTREQSFNNVHYSDNEGRKLIKKFEEMNMKSEDQKRDDKKDKESKVKYSADVDELTDTISSLGLSPKEKADRKKTRDQKKVRYLERGPDKGKADRRQQVTASVAPYTSRPTVSVNWGNLSGGHCIPGRESSTDSLPITIRNDDDCYPNSDHPTAVQYDAPYVPQNVAPFPQQNIGTFVQQNVATFPQENIAPNHHQSTALFVQQDSASLTHSEREYNWEDIELTIQDLSLFLEHDDDTDAIPHMLKLTPPCSPDLPNGMNGELPPLEIYGGQNNQYPSLEDSPLSQTGSSPTQFNQSPTIDRAGNDLLLPNSQGLSPEWVYPSRFPESSPISHGSPSFMYSPSNWNQRNGDSSSFSSLESPPILGNDDYLLNKQAVESDLNPIFATLQPRIQGISDTIVGGNFEQNQLYMLASEVSVNIDPLITSVAVSSIQQIQNELEPSQVAARPCHRCQYDIRNATDVLCEEFGNLDRAVQRNILRNVHRYDEAKVMICFDSLLLAYENSNPSNLLQASMYSVCERLLMTASTKTKFFQTNEMGHTALDRAVLNCSQTPILSRYLAECCIRALPAPPDKDCIINRNDADRNGLLHRAVSKGESCLPHLAGLLELNRLNNIFDINQKNADGYSPLHLALTACSGSASAPDDLPVCRGVCLTLAHLLLEHGNADPNIKAHKNGNTPLHVAVDTKACASNLVSLLLQYKAIISSTNYSKLTPMDLAKLVAKSSRTKVSKEVVKIMKEYIRRQRINNNNNKM